jgi:hypothetical protein
MNIQKISIGLLILGLMVGVSILPASADWKSDVIDELESPSDDIASLLNVYKTPWMIYPNNSHSMNILIETNQSVDDDHKHIYIDLNPNSECDLLNSSCNNNFIRASYHVVGGPCEYTEIHGTATITWTGDPVIDAGNCKKCDRNQIYIYA